MGRTVGVNESMSLAGLMKMSGGREHGQQWKCTCVSCISDPLGLTGMVMKVDTDEGKVEHSGINTHGQRGALLVMGTILAVAKGTAGVGSAGRAGKATIAAPKGWGLGHMAEQEGGCRAGVKGHHMATPAIGLMHHSKRVSECSLSWNKCKLARGTKKLGPIERGSPEGPVRTWEECD